MKKIIVTIFIVSAMMLPACGRRELVDVQAPDATIAVPASETTPTPIPVVVDPNLNTSQPTAAVPSPTPTLEIVYVTQSPTTPAPQIVTVDPYTLYGDVISRYQRCINEGWSVETCYSNGVNYLVPISVQNGAQIGYCFRDVDGSGIPELFIGPVGSPQIYAMYTMNGSTPVQVIDAGERSAYYLEPDNVFVNVCSNSAFSSGFRILELKGTSLRFMFAMIADYSVNEANPWVLTYKDDWNYYNGTPKSNESAEAARQAYEDNYVYLPYLPLV